jgi:hypothetical protein
VRVELKVDHFAGRIELRQIQRRNYTQDIEKVKKKEIRSRFIFQLSNDFHELCTKNYLLGMQSL